MYEMKKKKKKVFYAAFFRENKINLQCYTQ